MNRQQFFTFGGALLAATALTVGIPPGYSLRAYNQNRRARRCFEKTGDHPKEPKTYPHPAGKRW